MKRILLMMALCMIIWNTQAQVFTMSEPTQMYWTHRPDIADSCYEFTYVLHARVNRSPELFGAYLRLIYWNDCDYGKNYINVDTNTGIPDNMPLFDTLYRQTSHYGIIDTFCGYDAPYKKGDILNFAEINAPHRRQVIYRGLIFLPEKCKRWYFTLDCGSAGMGSTWSRIQYLFYNGTNASFGGYTNIKSNIDSFSYNPFYNSDSINGIYSQTIVGCVLNNLDFQDNSSARFLSPPLYYFQNGQQVEYNPGAYIPDQDSLVIGIPDTFKCSHDIIGSGGVYYPFFSNYNVFGAPMNDVAPSHRFFAPLPGQSGPNPLRYNGLNNPFDTDSTFHLVDSTGKTTFTAQSDMQPILFYKASTYRNGILKGESYYVQAFTLINDPRPVSFIKLDTSGIQGALFNNQQVLLGCQNQAISLQGYIKLPNVTPASANLQVRTTADTSLPGNAVCNLSGLNSDSVHFSFNWTPPPNAKGLYNLYIMAKDSNCTAPYNHYLQVYTISFYIDSCLAPMATNDLSKPDDLLIYPNPASQQIHIQYPESGAMQYTIMNNLGEKLQEGHLNIIAHTVASIPVHEIKAGIYFIRFKIGEKVFTKRVVVER